ncbi:MAG: redox-sensitive transcriptional activator SoxR [Brucellaceae bacterium]|nr:redox-sensitive transcriptional activator SoxR [Brucellaceae bacterium]
MATRGLLSIGEVAERTGLAVSAIRYYEAEGLVSAVRSAGGRRLFARADIRRLSFVMIVQQLGFSLDEIRDHLATLPLDRAPTRADWTRISRHIRGELDRRIAMMQRLRDKLDGCIGCGCLSLDNCVLYNPKDKVRSTGTGPRLVIEG